MLPVEANRTFWSGLRVGEQGFRALDVGGLGDVWLFLACGVADDGGQMDDGIDAFQSGRDGSRVADVALDQLEEPVLAAGQEALSAELERVEHADAVALFQEHRNQG